MFQKQALGDFKLGVLKNFVNSTGKHLCWGLFLIKLHTSRSATLLERLQHSCFPVKLAKFLRTFFFTEEFQWLLLTFSLCFQRSSKRKPVRLSVINTRFSWKKYLPRKYRSNHRRFCIKEGLHGSAQGFPLNIASFLSTPILKNTQTSVSDCFWKSAPQ